MTHPGDRFGRGESWRNREQGSFASTASDVTTIRPTILANLERGVSLTGILPGEAQEPQPTPEDLSPLKNLHVTDRQNTAEGPRRKNVTQNRWSSFMPLYQGPVHLPKFSDFVSSVNQFDYEPPPSRNASPAASYARPNSRSSKMRDQAPIDHGLQAPPMADCDNADGDRGSDHNDYSPMSHYPVGTKDAPHTNGGNSGLSIGIVQNNDAGGVSVNQGPSGSAPTGNGGFDGGKTPHFESGSVNQGSDDAHVTDKGFPLAGSSDDQRAREDGVGRGEREGGAGQGTGEGPRSAPGSSGNYDHQGYIHRDEFKRRWNIINRDIHHIANNVEELTTQVNQGFQAITTAIESRFPKMDTISPDLPATSARRLQKVKVPKETSFPIRRSPKSNAEAKAIRDHLSGLVGAGSRIQTVSEEESIAFSAKWNMDEGQNCGPCCTIENFKIDLNRDPTCPWNRSAAEVFFRSFIAHHQIQGSEDVYDTITARFFTRIKTLKSDYRTRILSARERAEKARKDRRAARKKTLFASRLEIAETEEHLRRHAKMLGLLGVRGMSSDESDSELVMRNPSQRRLETPITDIIRPRWRSTQVTLWLRTFDVVYHVHRRSKGATRGAWPHIRREDGEKPRYSDSSTFVWGLPGSAYDPRWLQSRRDAQFSVRPSAEEYQFVHDPALMNEYLRSEPLG